MNDNSENDPNLRGLTATIQEDFQRPLATLSSEIESLDDREYDMLAALRNAKFVAEPSLELSERLARSIDGQAA